MSLSSSRILIADDHVLVAELCKRLLEPEFAVIGIVANGADLVSKAILLKPDLILVDVAMPVLNGISAASQVKALLPGVKVVYLTMNYDPEIALDAFDKGASGFLLKTCAASELVITVRTVLKGRTYMSPSLRETVQQLRWERVKPLPEEDRLTARQREVLQLLAQGKQMKEVGESLGMTPRTVAFHKYRIMAAVGAKSNADLVKYALRHGMVAAYQPETLSAQDSVVHIVAA